MGEGGETASLRAVIKCRGVLPITLRWPAPMSKVGEPAGAGVSKVLPKDEALPAESKVPKPETPATAAAARARQSFESRDPLRRRWLPRCWLPRRWLQRSPPEFCRTRPPEPCR